MDIYIIIFGMMEYVTKNCTNSILSLTFSQILLPIIPMDYQWSGKGNKGILKRIQPFFFILTIIRKNMSVRTLVRMSVSTNACQYECLSVQTSVSRNVCQYECLSAGMSVSRNVCQYECLSVRMSVSTNVCHYEYLYEYLYEC